MQLLPSTGRHYARTIKRRFSMSLLTTADSNLRMGMKYFADLVSQFGGVHYALASYNAGPNRVVRWKADNPEADRDEFIDAIPFPETQNYVKKILGTAEDYRRLYGSAASAADAADAEPAVAASSRRPPAARASATAPRGKGTAVVPATKPAAKVKPKSKSRPAPKSKSKPKKKATTRRTHKSA